MNLVRLEIMRKEVIEAVEKQCRGSSESVLPAIFFYEVKEDDFITQAKLKAYIDMFNIGRGVSK